MPAHLHIMTGGPGSGKSSQIAELANRGVKTSAEGGRAIIEAQQRIGGSALPWADRALFAEWMLCWDVRSFHAASAEQGPVLMDRGIPDILGYLTLSNLPIPAHFQRAATSFRYAKLVFLAPYWPEIYTQDSERRQDLADAKATTAAMMDIYQKLDYRLVTLPRDSIAARADFVLDQLQKG